MTKIELRYNPFMVKTEIFVDEEEIAKTSSLYRLRNTPMEEWVEIFMPEIVDYCNDDRIEINFKGLQRHADILENAINSYMSKNRTMVVKFSCESSTGYRGRLGELARAKEKLSSELGELENDENILEDFPKTYKPEIEILVVSSGNAESKLKYVNDLVEEELAIEDEALKYVAKERLGDDADEIFKIVQYESALIKGKPIDFKITILPDFTGCSNEYWQYFRNSIKESKDTIVVAVLSKEGKYINDEMLDYISEIYLEKGKINKQRFIFVSEDIHKDSDYLSGEFGLKKASVIGTDDVKQCKEIILEYANAYCIPRYIMQSEEKLESVCTDIRKKVCDDAEKRKQNAELDEKERLLFEIVGYVKKYYGDKKNFSMQINCEKLADDILYSFKKKVADKIRGIQKKTKIDLEYNMFDSYSEEWEKDEERKKLETEYNHYFDNEVQKHLIHYVKMSFSKNIKEQLKNLDKEEKSQKIISYANILEQFDIIIGSQYRYQDIIQLNDATLERKLSEEVVQIDKKRKKLPKAYIDEDNPFGRKNLKLKESYNFFDWFKERCRLGFLNTQNYEHKETLNEGLNESINALRKYIEEMLQNIGQIDEYINTEVIEQKEKEVSNLEENLYECFKIMHENLSISDSDAMKIENLDELIQDTMQVIEL